MSTSKERTEWQGSRIKIQVDSEVHRTLRELKGRGESFNDVIKRLVLRTGEGHE